MRTSDSVRLAIWLNAWASGLAARTRRSSTRALKSPAAIARAACSTRRSCRATGRTSKAMASAAGSSTRASVVVAALCSIRSKLGNGPKRTTEVPSDKGVAASQRSSGCGSWG